VAWVLLASLGWEVLEAGFKSGKKERHASARCKWQWLESYPELPGGARSCSCPELPGAARSCPELPGAARSYPELPGGTRSCPELHGVARSCPECSVHLLPSTANVETLLTLHASGYPRYFLLAPGRGPRVLGRRHTSMRHLSRSRTSVQIS